jgi:hypothetical protein
MVRSSLSAAPEDWALLDELVTQGAARNRSEAFRLLCQRHRQLEALEAATDEARKIDPNELTALATPTAPTTTPAWSALIDEDA